MADSFIDVSNVHAKYHAKYEHDVLRNVSFSMNAGDHVVVFGLPASGKSSFLKLLCGDIAYHSGTVVINGKTPNESGALRSGYVSLHDESLIHDTVFNCLHIFGEIHGIEHLPARIGEITQILGIAEIVHQQITELSTTQKMLCKIAHAALSASPLVLLDDVADTLGVDELRLILTNLFSGRAVIITTRIAQVAEELGLPLLVIHKGTIAHSGKRNDIAVASGVPRVVDAWIEELRYDLLRSLRSHTGVLDVRIVPTDQFSGNRVRITIRNSRFMPSLYDMISQVSVVRIEEVPASLTDILESLE